MLSGFYNLKNYLIYFFFNFLFIPVLPLLVVLGGDPRPQQRPNA